MGAPFSLPVSVTPQQVFTPGSLARPSAVIFNNGPNPVFVGGPAVSSVSGVEVPPGGQAGPLSSSQDLFAVSGFNPNAAVAGTTSAAAAQGGSVLTVASGGTAFTAGMFIGIETGTARQEVLAVAASAAGSVTTSSPFAFAHGSAVTFQQVFPATSVVTVAGGAQ